MKKKVVINDNIRNKTIETIYDSNTRNINLLYARQNNRSKVITPIKGKGSKYKRDNNKRKYDNEY